MTIRVLAHNAPFDCSAGKQFKRRSSVASARTIPTSGSNKKYPDANDQTLVLDHHFLDYQRTRWSFYGCSLPVMNASKLTDHQRYRVLWKSGYHSGITVCQGITASLNGECVLFTAKSAVESRKDGLRYCGPNRSMASMFIWSHECLGQQDEKQINLQTNRFWDGALSFTSTWRNQIMTRFPLGKEPEMIAAIQTRVESLGVDELDEEPLSQTLCSRIIAKRFLSHWEHNKSTPFRYSACGKAPKTVCDSVYKFILKQQAKRGKQLVCNEVITPTRAFELGFPKWSEPMNSSAVNAWENGCKQQSGQNQKPPDFQESQSQNPAQ